MHRKKPNLVFVPPHGEPNLFFHGQPGKQVRFLVNEDHFAARPSRQVPPIDGTMKNFTELCRMGTVW